MLVLTKPSNRAISRYAAACARECDRTSPGWFWREVDTVGRLPAPVVRGRDLTWKEFDFLCRAWRRLAFNRRERREPRHPGHAAGLTPDHPMYERQQEWQALVRARRNAGG